jgi:hypothetical protein
MGPVARWFGLSWSDYLTGPASDASIRKIIIGLGILLGFCGLGTLLIPLKKIPINALIILGSMVLLFQSVLIAIEHFGYLSHFIEHTAQWATPLITLYVIYNNKIDKRIQFIAKVVLALTFTGHGLLALGIYPTPPHFIEMVMNILNINQQQSIILLRIAGVLDILIAIGIFFPKTVLLCLGYAVFWGFATSIARVWAHVDIYDLQGLETWLHESIYRLVHGLLPLFLFFVNDKQDIT